MLEVGEMMKNLATPAEMVQDILHSPELQIRISAEAFVGLMRMAEKEKAACSEQADIDKNSVPVAYHSYWKEDKPHGSISGRC